MFWRRKTIELPPEDQLKPAEKAVDQYPHLIPNINLAMNHVRQFFSEYQVHSDYHPFNFTDHAHNIPNTLYETIRYYAAFQQAVASNDSSAIPLLQTAYHNSIQSYFRIIMGEYPDAKQHLPFFYATLTAANLIAGGVTDHDGELHQDVRTDYPHFQQLVNELAIFFETRQPNALLKEFCQNYNINEHTLFNLVPHTG